MGSGSLGSSTLLRVVTQRAAWWLYTRRYLSGFSSPVVGFLFGSPILSYELPALRWPELSSACRPSGLGIFASDR